MNEQQIIREIKNFADDLKRQGFKTKMSDLAAELKKFGIADNEALNQLVYQAYKQFGQDKNIRTVFMNNEGTRSAVDDYAVSDKVANNDIKGAWDLIDADRNEARDNLNKLNTLVTAFENGNFLQVMQNDPEFRGMLQTVMGTKGVTEITTEANKYYSAYKRLIEAYGESRDDVRQVMKEFVDVRTDIANRYRDYASRLVDVFGDKIKMVAPQLFDFDSVQYLDTAQMLDNITLQYDSLCDSCQQLINDICNNFQNSIGIATKGYRQAGGGWAGLVLSAVTMGSHYMQASAKEAQKRRELEVLKQNMKHDVTTIAADHSRLAHIYRTVNGVYLPAAIAFYENAFNGFERDLIAMTDALYNSPKMEQLVKERNNTLSQYSDLENQIIYHQMQIDCYTESIAKSEDTIKDFSDEYRAAMRRKPQKPLLPFFSNYNRDFYEWNQRDGDMVRQYEEYKTSIKLDRDDLKAHQQGLKSKEQEIRQVKAALDIQNRRLREALKQNPEVMRSVAPRLKEIVQVLRDAKAIMEYKIDSRHIEAVRVTDYRQTELPADIQEGLKTFGDEIRKLVNKE